MMMRNLLWPACVLSFVVTLSLGQPANGKIDVWTLASNNWTHPSTIITSP